MFLNGPMNPQMGAKTKAFNFITTKNQMKANKPAEDRQYI